MNANKSGNIINTISDFYERGHKTLIMYASYTNLLSL
jgi:hypothetical protein